MVRSLVLVALSALLGTSLANEAQFICARTGNSFDNSHCEQDLGRGISPNKQMMQTMHSCIWDITGGAVGVSLNRLDTSDEDSNDNGNGLAHAYGQGNGAGNGGGRNLRGVEDFERELYHVTFDDCLYGCPCNWPDVCCATLGFCGSTCDCTCGCARRRELESGEDFEEPMITLGNGTDVTIDNLNAYLASECTKEVRLLAKLYREVGNNCLGKPNHLECNVVVS